MRKINYKIEEERKKLKKSLAQFCREKKCQQFQGVGEAYPQQIIETFLFKNLDNIYLGKVNEFWDHLIWKGPRILPVYMIAGGIVPPDNHLLYIM